MPIYKNIEGRYFLGGGKNMNYLLFVNHGDAEAEAVMVRKQVARTTSLVRLTLEVLPRQDLLRRELEPQLL